ncbi:MAG: flavodoxin family protein [Methanobrevibacter sp.]|jgi:multimeric flavodoxin WrbA|nr:flavodoxin family protein [Candidatus Methanovirga aequatorialis]
MAKVVLLSGSPRKDSNSMEILDICAKSIESKDVDTEIVSLRGMNVESCIACNECNTKGNCVLKDGLDKIIDKIRDAEGFIPVAPVYFGTARGDIMAALQRIGKVSKGNGKFLSWMVGGPIAVARRGGQSLTLQEMSMFFPINDMIMVGSDYWNIVFALEEKTAHEDEEGVATIRKFGENVASLIKKIN